MDGKYENGFFILFLPTWHDEKVVANFLLIGRPRLLYFQVVIQDGSDYIFNQERDKQLEIN